MDNCQKHGPHSPGECPECDELAEARSIVATAWVPPAEHIEAPDCWCNPTLDYVDPVTGNAVYVHHKPN